MNKIILSFMLMCSVCSAETVNLWENKIGGLDTQGQSTRISPNDFTDMNAVYTDEGNYVDICEGLSNVWTTTGAIRFQYEYIDSGGQRYFLFVASNALNVATSYGSYSTLISTIDLTSDIWATTLDYNCYIGDSAGQSWKFDGTRLYISSATMWNCKDAITAYGKVFLLSNETGTKSRVVYSRVGDPENIEGDYWIDANPGDGEDSSAIFLVGANIVVGKPHSMYQLLNIEDDINEGDDIIQLSKTVGVSHKNSVQEINGNWYWAYEHGIVQYNGSSFRIISNKINNLVKTVSELRSSEKTISDSSASDFGKGTVFVNVDTTTTLGTIKVQTLTSYIKETSTHQIQGITNALGALGGNNMNLADGNAFQIIKPSVTCLLTDIEMYISSRSNSSIPMETRDLRVDFCSISSAVVATSDYHTFTLTASRWIKCHFTDTIWLSSGTQYMIKPYCDIDSDNVTVGHYSNTDTYTRGTSNISGGDLCFSLITSSQPTYISSVLDVRTQGEDWKMWQKASFTSSNITMQYRTGLNATDVLLSTFTAIENYGVIGSTIGTAIQYKIIMNTYDAYLDDVSFSYFVNGNPITLGSMADQLNDRYYLTCSISPSTKNDRIFVWQNSNESLTQINNLNIRSMGYYKYVPHFGSSDNSVSKIYIFSDDYSTFDGTSKDPYIETGDWNCGTEMSNKIYNQLWTYFTPSTVFSSATVSYYINTSTSAYKSCDVSLTAPTNYPNMVLNRKINSPLSLRTHRYIRFRIENFERFLGLTYVYEMLNPFKK